MRISSIVLVLFAAPSGLGAEPFAARTGGGSESRAALRLIENLGQWEEGILFAGSVGGASVFATERALVLELLDGEGEGRGRRVRLSFEDAHEGLRLEGLERAAGVHHFFLGKDPARWRSGAASYGGLRWREAWPGIDLELRSGEGGLKYDLLVAPGADLSRAVIRCEGTGDTGDTWNTGGLRELEDGSLDLGGGLLQRAGATWEVLGDGSRRPVRCLLRRRGERSFGFEVEDRDASRPLVIDPGLVWSTYLGSASSVGVGDRAFASAVDAKGDLFVVGFTNWGDFPHTDGAFQSPGPFLGGSTAGSTFVSKLSGKDGTLVWSSILGGTHHQERLVAVAVDDLGRPTAGGWTFSLDFPTTPGAYDPVKTSITGTAIVLRLSTDGSALEYSTFVESSWFTEVRAVDVEKSTGRATFGGLVNGILPTTPGAFQPAPPVADHGDGFVGRLDPTGSTLEWLTYFGGREADEIHALCVDLEGRVTVTGLTSSPDLPVTPGAFDTSLGTNVGANAFVTRFDPTGSSLVWSTYLGGNGANLLDEGLAIAAAPEAGVLVAGFAGSFDFPTTPGSFHQAGSNLVGGFVSRFSVQGELVRSTYLASAGGITITALRADRSGVVTVTGRTLHSFPVTGGAYAVDFGGGVRDGFVTRFDPSLSKLLYSSYVGGPRDDWTHGLAMTPEGRVTIAGFTFGPGFPTTPGTHSPTYAGGQTDAFVATLELYPEGTEPIGESLPSCLGPLQLNATERPDAGSASFTLWASGAPPLAKGWLFLARPGPQGTLSTQGILHAAAFALPIESDKDGYLEIPFPLTSAEPGKRFLAQVLFRPTPTCTGPRPFSTSPALQVTVR